MQRVNYERALRTLAESVPYLAATKGQTPRVDHDDVAFALQLPAMKTLLVVTDHANGATHTLEFDPSDITPGRALRGVVNGIYAPFN